jgi:hypothetical protein
MYVLPTLGFVSPFVDFLKICGAFRCLVVDPCANVTCSGFM